MLKELFNTSHIKQPIIHPPSHPLQTDHIRQRETASQITSVLCPWNFPVKSEQVNDLFRYHPMNWKWREDQQPQLFRKRTINDQLIHHSIDTCSITTTCAPPLKIKEFILVRLSIVSIFPQGSCPKKERNLPWSLATAFCSSMKVHATKPNQCHIEGPNIKLPLLLNSNTPYQDLLWDIKIYKQDL